MIVPLELKDELVDFLGTPTDMSLSLVCLDCQFVQFLLQLADLPILSLYLILFDGQ